MIDTLNTILEFIKTNNEEITTIGLCLILFGLPILAFCTPMFGYAPYVEEEMLEEMLEEEQLKEEELKNKK